MRNFVCRFPEIGFLAFLDVSLMWGLKSPNLSKEAPTYLRGRFLGIFSAP
jgi:hypothetical protein